VKNKMRNVIVSNSVTLDGFFEGPNKELDWHIVDEEVKQYANDLLSKVDALLFGRLPANRKGSEKIT
jgi:hypothetical protein